CGWSAAARSTHSRKPAAGPWASPCRPMPPELYRRQSATGVASRSPSAFCCSLPSSPGSVQMRSSISSSSSARSARGIGALLAAIVLTGIALEAGTRLAVPLINHNQRRVEREYRSALTLGHEAASDPIPVLLLGNSLTLTD